MSYASIPFQITMTNGLNISIDRNNPNEGAPVILSYANTNDPDQVWYLFYIPSFQASVIYNPGRKMVMAPNSIEKYSAITLLSDGGLMYNPENTWNIAGNGIGSAVRIAADTDLNLNAIGSGPWVPGTQLCLYDWEGDKENMQWTFGYA